MQIRPNNAHMTTTIAFLAVEITQFKVAKYFRVLLLQLFKQKLWQEVGFLGELSNQFTFFRS